MKHHSVRDRARTGLAVIGAAAVIVAGIGAVSQAANGDFLKLGSKNKATKTTTLKNTKAKPALKLKVKSGPALSVNTSDLIANLNADSTDGKGLDELEPTTYTTTLGARGQAGSGSPALTATTVLPAGTYSFHLNGLLNSGAGDFNVCAVLDLTRYLLNPLDATPLFVIDGAHDGDDYMEGDGLGTVTAGNRLAFLCNIETTTTYETPVSFTVKKLDRTASVPGVGPTTIPKGSLERLPGSN